MPVIPKTHLEFVIANRPGHLQDVKRRIAALPEGQLPMTMEQAIDTGAKRHLLNELIAWARPNLQREGYQLRGLSEDRIIGLIPQQYAESFFSNLNQEYLALLNFMLGGEKVFHFSEALVSRLAETELNVDVDLVRVPFKSCMFVFDDALSRNSLYATFGKVPPSADPITVYVSELQGKLGKTLGMQIIHGGGSAGRFYYQVNRSLLLKPESRVEDVLRTDWIREGQERLPPSYGDRQEDEVFYGPGLRFFRIVANAVLYLSSTHPDLSELIEPNQSKHIDPGMSNKERKRIASEDHLSSKLRYIDVGPNARPLEDLEEGEEYQSVSGNKLDHRVKVRPHWRPQAYGPRHSQRKLIYIESFWRGPEPADVINRPYIVR